MPTIEPSAEKLTAFAIRKAAILARTSPADADIRNDLNNTLLWRHLLLESGHTIDEVPLPRTIPFDPITNSEIWGQYELDRGTAIREMPAAKIASYCRQYRLRIHNRLCPDYLSE